MIDQHMTKHIPNGLSILNLICGVIGVVMSLNGHLVYASYSIFMGGIFDFLDGFAARILSAQSPIGKQLDALADIITFGMVPAGIVYMLMKAYAQHPYLPYLAIWMVVCSACRLAKFNVDDRQVDRFIGLPTPANAIMIATLPMILERSIDGALVNILTQPVVLPLIVLILSYLLVSDFVFIAFKFQGFSFQVNKSRYFLISITALLMLILEIEGVFFSVLFYIFYSLCPIKKRPLE